MNVGMITVYNPKVKVGEGFRVLFSIKRRYLEDLAMCLLLLHPVSQDPAGFHPFPLPIVFKGVLSIVKNIHQAHNSGKQCFSPWSMTVKLSEKFSMSISVHMVQML